MGDRLRFHAVLDHFVDLDPSGTVLIVTNKDVPGVIGKIGTILGNAAVNIAGYHMSHPRPHPGEALAAITLEVRCPTPVIDELRKVPEVTGVWQADLGPKA